MSTTLGELLEKRNISPKMLMETSGVSIVRINMLKSGKMSPGEEEMRKICEALEVKPEFIFPSITSEKKEKVSKLPFKVLDGCSAPEEDNGTYIANCNTFNQGSMDIPTGGLIQADQQWIIGIGIDYSSLPAGTMSVSLAEHLVNHELWVYPFPFEHRGQASIAIFNHGKTLQLKKNLPIVRLIIPSK